MANADPAHDGALEARLKATLMPLGPASVDEVVREIAPAMHVLRDLFERDASGSAAARESLTVLTLLGRRLALLGVTVSAALAAVNAAFGVLDLNVPATAGAAVTEGFVLGREEDVGDAFRTKAAECIRPVRINADCFALIASGDHEPDVLRDKIDELGRLMLDGGATRACIDVSQLARPTPEHAAAVFSADHVLRVVGAQSWFSGVDHFWQQAAQLAHIDHAQLATYHGFADALAAAEEDRKRDAGRDGFVANLRRRLTRLR